MTETENVGPSSYQLAIILALQSKHVYANTVDENEIARRRKASKRARLQRRTNRRLDTTRRS
ncbi:hypothetical protein SEA_BEUFFERT_94 [Streptomyces phage Beuffert]|nr:hypothetical protein SEA_BEUFFERT_94 [Streptomyces phage Beuffert]